MNCDESQDCMARCHPETPCWEIASELNDYRHAMDICRDCIVYMLKVENSILSEQEMNSIMTNRAKCVPA